MEDRAAHRPIYSSHAGNPELTEALDCFAIGLAERIDALQDTEVRGDFASLEAQARALASEAGQLGYPALADAATETMHAARSRNAEGTRKALLATTDLARRVRLGHRGAA